MLEGKAADVPIIIGTNKNEGSIFMGMEPMIMKVSFCSLLVDLL